MKRIMLVVVMLASHLQAMIIDQSCVSHSVFVPRSITHNPLYELALANYDFYHHEQDAWHGDLYLTPFYQHSFNGKKMAPYFLPYTNSNMIVLSQAGYGHVNPTWLNLLALNGDYTSVLAINPLREVYGVSLTLFKDLSCWRAGWWANATFTPMHVRHDLQLTECLLGESGGLPGIANGIDALNNPALLFGKYNRCPMSRSGLDDIQVKLGYNHYTFTDGHYGIYAVGTIPTGQYANPGYIFSPRVGTRNGALGFGVNTDCAVPECYMRSAHIMFDFKYRYLFGAHECRSFDTCANGQWSRFLPVVSQGQPSCSQPGVNCCFTQEVKVTPGSQIDMWLALHIVRHRWHYEFGYALWWRDGEKVRPKEYDAPKCSLGIYDMFADANRQNAQARQVFQPLSATTAHINDAITHLVSDAVFTYISQLNYLSGAHPRALTNSFYFASEYDFCNAAHGAFIGYGASIELAAGQTALSNWSLWGKCGVHF